MQQTSRIILELSLTPPFAFALFPSNHLTTLDYYKTILKMMQWLERPMEFVMMNWAKHNCSLWGQHVYGNRGANASYLVHVDGRVTQNVSIVPV